MMKKSIFLICLCWIMASCSATRNVSSAGYGSPRLKQDLLDEHTFKIEVYSQDKTYGYGKENPVMVGGAMSSEGPKNERRFLDALAGPKGETISYYRIGSCCNFKTKNSPFGGGGLLDRYSISWDGLEEPVTIYINMYDSDTLKVPVGFTLRQ